MDKKKFIISAIVVFVVLEILNFLIHGVLLNSAYMSNALSGVFRPQAEMESLMWVMWVTDIVWTFFFVYFFVKGYENKGIMEGIRYGVYIGFFVSFVYAYQAYVVYPITYGLTIQWFILGFVQSIILGVLVSILYKPVQKTT